MAQRSPAGLVDDDAVIAHLESRELGTQCFNLEQLTDGLEHGVGRQLEVLSGRRQTAVVIQFRPLEADGRNVPVTLELYGASPVMEGHAVRLREILFELTRSHVLRTAPIHDVDHLGTETLALHGNVYRRHATTDYDNAPSNRQFAKILGLSNVRNVFDRAIDTWQGLPLQAELVGRAQADADKHRVVPVSQFLQREILAERLAVLQFYATDRQDVFHFLLRKIVDCLVRGDAVFVQAARFEIPVEHDDVVAKHRQPMRARQPGRTGAHHRNGLSGRRLAIEELRSTGEDRVRRITLQQADLDGLVLVRISDAGLFAEYFGRANARAHAAHDVLAQNRVRGAAQVIAANLLNKTGNVDARGAGRGAGCVVTKIAAVRGGQRRIPGKRWMQIGEIQRDLAAIETMAPNIRLNVFTHRLTASGCACWAWTFSAS